MASEYEIKEFVESYTDANGDNPISAAFSLWTIAKATPFQLIKAGLFGWFFLSISFILGWILGLPFLYFLIMQITALVIFVFLTFFAAIKFLSSIVVNAVAELISGILSPIDDMYEVYDEASEDNLSRFQFSKKVLQEVVFPRVSDILKFVPMKKSISKTLSIFVSNASVDDDDVSYEEITNSSVKSMMAKVNKAANNTKSIIGKPFYISIILYLMLWSVMVMGYFVGWY